MLSPLLFNVYMDGLSCALNDIDMGCKINGKLVNHLFYADDSVIIAPNASCLQKLLNICNTFASNNDILYNVKKTKCMRFLPKWLKNMQPHKIFLGERELDFVNTQMYLGVPISNDMADNLAIKQQTKAVYARGNMLIKYFKKCTMEVKCQLFVSYCTSVYCAYLWNNYNKSTINAIKVAYNNVFRAFTGTKRGNTRHTMVNYNIPTFEVLVRNGIFSFYQRLSDCANAIVENILNSLSFICSHTNTMWTMKLRNF